MMVQVPDSTLDFDAGPCAGPKNYEILKFDELQVFNVFGDMNGVNVNFGWFSDQNEC